MCNVVYALLAERATEQDRTELLFAVHAKENAQERLARNREELDAWLSAPMGVQAVAEQKLVKELGGAA